MPLVKSPSKAAVGQNIKREMSAGKPQKQAVAIALNTQRQAKKIPARDGLVAYAKSKRFIGG